MILAVAGGYGFTDCPVTGYKFGQSKSVIDTDRICIL